MIGSAPVALLHVGLALTQHGQSLLSGFGPSLQKFHSFFCPPSREIMSTWSRAVPQLAARSARRFHCSPFRAAVAHPITAHGPPPKAPSSPQFQDKAGLKEEKPRTDDASTQPSRSQLLKKRFWNDVHIHGKQGTNYEVHLFLSLNADASCRKALC